MRPKLGIYAKLIEGGKKPPTHFHPYQWEFFRVLRGNLTIDLNGVAKHVTKEDGEIAVRPYTHHVIYGTPGTEMDEVEFVVSASDAEQGSESVLDRAFFENWYGYQEDVFQRGEKLDLIQVLAVSTSRSFGKLFLRKADPVCQMFDAGHSYLSPPSWVPFRSVVGLWLGIILGRWIGGLIGYAPYYPEWTTDWQQACDKMEQTWVHKRYSIRDAQEKARSKWQKAAGLGKSQ